MGDVYIWDGAINGKEARIHFDSGVFRASVDNDLTKQDLASAGSGYVDVASHGFNTVAINAAVAAAVANGTRHIKFTKGTYTVAPPPGTLFDGYAVGIPGNFRVSGEHGNLIVQTGLGEAPDTESFCYAVFRPLDDTHHVVFDGLNFKGQKPKGQNPWNHQSSAIDWEVDPVAETISSDGMVRNCAFEDLWGFPVHSRGPAPRIHVIDCTVTDCANGVNVNGDLCIQSFNTFRRSEGIECCGAYCTFVGNVFEDSVGVALSIGGAGADIPGCSIIGNTINGSTAHGIVAGGGLQYGVVACNTARGCEQHGILVTFDEFGFPSDGMVVSNNVVLDCAHSGVIAGLAIHGGTKHAITGNVAISTGAHQRVGISVTAPDCYIGGNTCKGGGPQPIDLAIGTTALRTVLGSNQLLTGTEQWAVGATVEPDRRSWPAADVVVYQDRLHNGPIGTGLVSGRVLHRRYASGKMEWGDGLEAVDTGLARAGAARLRVTGRMEASSLGVANAASATNLGSVAKRIEVFDAAGNSLGYVPVYDSIT